MVSAEMAEAVIGMIVEKLTELVMEGISWIIVGIGELESLRSELKDMQRLLEKSPKKKLLLWKDVEGLVNEADYLVDEIMDDGCLKFQRQLNSRKKVVPAVEDWGFVVEKLLARFWPRSKIPEKVARLTQRIRLVNARLRAGADEDEEKSVRSCGIEEDLLVADDDLDDDDFVVVREDARVELISRLLDNDHDGGKQEGLRIVIITGMSGIGKTALAKNLVHKDGSVRSHFDCISWARVGKDFRTRKVLEQLLLQQHVFESRGEMIPFLDLDLAQKLYEFLQYNKYLIVLDDVWSTDAWDCLRIAFPSRETSASRVLLTTRDPLVAEKIASSANNNGKGFVYQLRPLNPDESWELLSETAFGPHYHPDQASVEHPQKYCSQQQLNRWQKVHGAVENRGFVRGSVVEKLLAPFCSSSKLPKEVARLTQRMVNGRLRATANDDMKENGEKSVTDCGIEEKLLVAEDDLGDDFFVDTEDAREELISCLLDDNGNPEGLRIVIITGLCGIGKTALAKSLVYKNGSVHNHFDCISWTTVGKDFRTRKVLEQLLLQQHVFESRGDMNLFSDLDLAQKLYEFLQYNKYLIVLDDVWSIDAWDCLRIAFPSRETSASRVLLTARDPFVAEKIASSANNNGKGFVYQLRPLNPDESWELLNETAFGPHYHPEQATVEQPQKYCSQQQLNRLQKVPGAVEDWGFVGDRVVEKLLAPFWPNSTLPKEVARLTQSMVNGRLRATANDDMKENEEKSVADCGIEENLLIAKDDLDDDFVLEREDAWEELISRLLDDNGKPEGLRIVIIHGIGKTTLAKELACRDCSIRCHFDCIAWATVGKDFRTRNVLEQLMLQHLCQTRDEMIPFSDLDLAQKLYEFLQHKKYLIVLDDVWSIDAWDCLRIAFPPRETSASRVLLTTRDNLVAEKIASSASNKGFVHRMRPLNQDESWEILHEMTLRRAHYHPGSLVSKRMVTNQTMDQCSKDTVKLKRIRLVNNWLEAADAAKQHQGQGAGS